MRRTKTIRANLGDAIKVQTDAFLLERESARACARNNDSLETVITTVLYNITK